MLHIHRAERADGLVASLGAVLARPLADPLAAEVVAVPTRGVERWLSQRLGARLGAGADRGDGICANVDFPFPGRLIGGAVAAAGGIDRDADPWLAERAVWPLVEIVDASLTEPWLAPLAAHLGGADATGDDPRRERRFAAARHLADLFDRYAVHRPDMVRAWAGGADGDGAGAALPSEHAWQPALWRRLRDRIGVPSPAERLEEACARLRADPALAELPERACVFGLTRLPASYLRVMAALAAHRDLHLFLLHPSAALWRRVAAQDPPAAAPPRARDRTARLPRNPLLASWGRDAREMQLVLAAGAGPAEHHHHPVEPPADTLLRRVQADVRADRPPGGGGAPPPLGEGDTSLQVHSCHGRARQVEVMRDAILHLLAEDETLEPRDVIVMCPDIEAYAPLVHAVFGAAAPDEEEAPAGPAPPDLRVRLADRSLRQTNAVLGVVAQLLELVTARVTASQVLDLAGREPVRRRFGFDDDELARIDEWTAATGVRWGLDAAHRAPFKLHAVAANTWRAGLDRLLLGVAMAEEGERLVAGVLPYDDVESGVIDLAGRLAELVDRLGAALDALRGPHTLREWTRAIATAADALTLVPERDAWQRAQLERILDDVLTEAGPGETPPFALPELRGLLADRLRGRPTRANFRTGHLTVCTLVPMRSVPHRVVGLLGLDHDAFPRGRERDGDDILLAEPRVGDRDARGEDRQLLLDALLAATDALVVTYAGRDERTNAALPPAVPVGELLDVVDRTVALTDGRPARAAVVVPHPLQPFDARNFAPGALRPGRWSFDAVALAGARAAAAGRRPRPPFLTGPLPPLGEDALELERLARFVQHPVRAFLAERLGLRLRLPAEARIDAMPIELDGLDRWEVGDRLLRSRLAGADPDRAVAAERARGLLPPDGLAEAVLAEVRPQVEALVRAAAGLLPPDAPAARSVEVDAVLPDGRRLTGSVESAHGDLVRRVVYSRLAPKHRIEAWVRLLALAAARPERHWSSALLGRGDVRPTLSRLQTPAGTAARRRDWALRRLDVVIDLRARGMREPLPLFCATSGAYATARAVGEDAVAAAGRAWTSGYGFPREDADPEHRLVHADGGTLADLLEAAPRADESGPGWPADEPSRFGRYARRLWDDLLACETREDA